MRELALRKNILDKVKVYYEKFHKQSHFVPGRTKIPYAGRVYDYNEIFGIIDSALDFWLTHGRLSNKLEQRLKNIFESRSFLLVNSGSSANLLMVASICAPSFKRRLKKGDEVITPAVSFPTTVGPLIQYGLIPVFVDARVGTYNINEELIEQAVTKKTKAILIPHTLGNPCDMDIILKIARKKRLIVLEDACDALDSMFGEKLVGTFGDMASFSFYPAHHITMGEGGGVNINNQDFVKTALSIRDWGRDCFCKTGQSNSCGKRFSMKIGDLPFGYDHKYVYSNIGYNLKVTEMQSSVGLAQLDKLKIFTQKRRDNFRHIYEGLLKYSEHIILPQSHSKASPSWFGFPISCKKHIDRLKLIKWLEHSKIETRLLFAGNITRQPAFKHAEYRICGKLTNTDYIMNNTFFIGVYPGLTEKMLHYIIYRFRAFFRDGRNFK